MKIKIVTKNGLFIRVYKKAETKNNKYSNRKLQRILGPFKPGIKMATKFQGIQFSQAVLIQLIQFSISTDFVYTQLNVKTVLY